MTTFAAPASKRPRRVLEHPLRLANYHQSHDPQDGTESGNGGQRGIKRKSSAVLVSIKEWKIAKSQLDGGPRRLYLMEFPDELLLKILSYIVAPTSKSSISRDNLAYNFGVTMESPITGRSFVPPAEYRNYRSTTANLSACKRMYALSKEAYFTRNRFILAISGGANWTRSKAFYGVGTFVDRQVYYDNITQLQLSVSLRGEGPIEEMMGLLEPVLRKFKKLGSVDLYMERWWRALPKPTAETIARVQALVATMQTAERRVTFTVAKVEQGTLTPTVLAAQHTLAPPFPHLAETLAKLPIAKVKDRIVFIPPYDYHTALDEYNARWETVLPHQTTRPLPSVGLDLFGLQSHAFIDAEGANPSVLSWPRATLLKANAFRFYCKVYGLGMGVVQRDREVKLKLRAEKTEGAEVRLLLRFLLLKEQHRFSAESMKWRTGLPGVFKDEINEGMVVVAVREAVQELIVEWRSGSLEEIQIPSHQQEPNSQHSDDDGVGAEDKVEFPEVSSGRMGSVGFVAFEEEVVSQAEAELNEDEREEEEAEELMGRVYNTNTNNCKVYGLGMGVVQRDREVKLKLRAEKTEGAEVRLLLRFLLLKEQHRFSAESMKWRTGLPGVFKDEINEGMVVVAVREAVQELIVECTGDGEDVEMGHGQEEDEQYEGEDDEDEGDEDEGDEDEGDEDEGDEDEGDEDEGDEDEGDDYDDDNDDMDSIS
ncbi:hypothetical protein B0A55_02286 [Friedmanniomyces simplex]|uniref:F-box domain-containing protein n=1 Tax=Friedmanniomyces simplex TaxID=329884 RepID=A0A4U0Y2F1_9PEZI|nr:hypothetical protein B0A55_02286 [Friedmanniomyces simplex]